MTTGKTKKRAVVICPGRGSYTKETLGYLKQFGGHTTDFLADLDARRAAQGDPTITALDSEVTFKPQVHTRGEHASVLIYACANADFHAIRRDEFEVVAIAGNSMGWYLSLAFGGALDWAGAFQVIQTMGGMMRERIIGGQLIYPVVDDEWRRDPAKVALVASAVERVAQLPGCAVYPSIHLGGYEVIGGTQEGIAALLKELPKVENYPFQLINHAAFHTPLLAETSAAAMAQISPEIFSPPEIPLIDGLGRIWQPYSTNPEALWHYTLGPQVTEVYDFTRSVEVAMKEFAPDCLILLGPGGSLGGSLAQILIGMDWAGLKNKADFMARQNENPILMSLGRPEQRGLVVQPRA